MIYYRPINAIERNHTQESFFRYFRSAICKYDWKCPLSVYCFSCIKRFIKKWVTYSWFSSCQFLFETGQVAHNLMGIKGIDQLCKDKTLVLLPKFSKICSKGIFKIVRSQKNFNHSFQKQHLASFFLEAFLMWGSLCEKTNGGHNLKPNVIALAK